MTEHAHDSVLVVFGAGALYGLERGVIEIFDLVRPEVDAQLLISRTPRRLGLPIFDEIERRGLPYSLLSDHDGWERLAKPKSPRHLWRVLAGLCRGNLDALRDVRGRRVLYLPNLFAACYACLAILYCRLSGRRVMFHFHELVTTRSVPLCVLWWCVTDVIHNSVRSSEIVFAANPFLRRKRSFVIPCPLPSRATGAGGGDLDAMFSNRRNLLFVGQVSWHKGVDILLDAFDLVSRSCSNVTLHIVGGCQDPALDARLKTSRLENGCRIHVWGYREDVLEMMKRADVYVHPTPPSRYLESFGIGMLEAMSLGVPGVCFASGGLQEIVLHERTGLLCDVETSDELAAAILRLLRDDTFRRACGADARRRYLEQYAPQLVKARWLDVLTDSRRRVQLRAASF